MKFAIHMGTLRGFGSGRVGRNVLRELQHVAPAHEFTAWLPDDEVWRGYADCVSTSIRVRPGMHHKFWAENLTMRRELLRGDYDALFSVGDTGMPACPRPHLLMVHQAYLAYRHDDWGFVVPPAFRLKMRLMEAYFRAGKASVTRFTVQSESMRRRLSERWDIAPSTIEVVPSFIDLSVLQSPAAPGDASSTPPYICYVASPSPHKSFEIFAPVMARLTRTWPDLTCRLTVSPEDVPALREAARRLGVEKQIEFLGRVENPGELLRGARALVMPSLLESFGLPYYEAMAAGVPVVAADRDFAREACGEAALYAEPGAAEDFAAQIDRLLRDATLRAALIEQGHARIARQDWSWGAAAARYVEILEEIAASGC